MYRAIERFIQISGLMGIVTLTGIVLLFVEPSDAKIDPNTAAGIWTFDGGDAKDSSKKGLNGNIAGGAKAAQGIVGKALRFDGKNGAVKIPDSADINTGGPYYEPNGRRLFQL